ncbi:response regulator [Roseomonas sp. SSH11]|uniref:Response regulator n=1 Tax=Pararoseomonas baculiformis TaxID=2820812 RepID=A0ABS4AFW1_9PROT|nr:response regulator [Pararoseomonas baculiformis]MBP0445891.1 response regulator [Pararoseomonas baculiformis]
MRRRRASDEVDRGDISVLVAEDESAIAEMIQEVLTDEGFRVTVAADGALALEEYSRNEFDVLLTDVRMPNLDGVGLVRRLRQIEADLPIVVLSGYMTGKDFGDLRQLGIPAESILEKPVTFTRLRDALRTALVS